MKTVRTLVLASNRLGYIVRGYFYIIKTIHNQFKSSQSIQVNSAFATIFDVCLVTFVHIFSTFSQFVSFPIFRTFSKVTEKDVLVKSSANLKSFLNRRFTFFFLKIVAFFSLSHTHTHKFCFKLKDPFFHCLSPFSKFSFHIVKIPF